MTPIMFSDYLGFFGLQTASKRPPMTSGCSINVPIVNSPPIPYLAIAIHKMFPFSTPLPLHTSLFCQDDM